MKNLFILTCFFICSFAFAQAEITTDRPDQTETAVIVPKGRFQAEAGFTHTRETADSDEFSVPSTLWKYGVNDVLELRLVTEFAFYKEDDSIARGLKPVIVGLKVNLWHEKGILPETSLITQLQLPKLGSKDFTARLLAPDIRMLFQNTINDKIEIGYNTGAIWDGEDETPSYEYTFSPSYKVSNKMKVFFESFAYLLPHERPDHWVDAGFMFLLSKNLQLDFAGGYELSAHNRYHGYYETLGISFRI
ncbi:MAG: transporter [Flavobacterium sp.]